MEINQAVKDFLTEKPRARALLRNLDIEGNNILMHSFCWVSDNKDGSLNVVNMNDKRENTELYMSKEAFQVANILEYLCFLRFMSNYGERDDHYYHSAYALSGELNEENNNNHDFSPNKHYRKQLHDLLDDIEA